MELDCNLNWKSHINTLLGKLNKGLFILSQISQSLYRKENIKVYFAFFHSFLSYGALLWCNALVNKNLCIKVFKKQKRAIRMLTFKKPRKQSCRGRFRNLGILTITGLFILQAALFAKSKLASQTNSAVHTHYTRSRNKLHKVHGHNKCTNYMAKVIFNKLPDKLTQIRDRKKFKCKLKTWLLEKEFYNFDEFLECNW